MSKPAMKRAAGFKSCSPSPPPLRRKIESTTTNKAVANFFTPTSKREPEKVSWRVVDESLLIGRYRPNVSEKGGSPRRRKIAAFDFDSTLIQTSSGNVFGKDAADWRWWHARVPALLKHLYSDGYSVVIISNQGGISLKSNSKTVKSDQRRLLQFKSKVGFVFNQLDIPISLYAATARDKYRKPRTGTWNEVVEEFDLDVDGSLDLQKCIFVGDAGGRSARTGLKADHSSSDRDFASNVGIDFKTPEEFFLQESPQPFERTFEPRLYLQPAPGSPLASAVVTVQATERVELEECSHSFMKRNDLDIVLFCGSPGAGKSTFYWNCLKRLGYERVNQDELKTRDKCLKVASEYLSSGKSVAVDNTNANVETRGHWVRLAQNMSLPIRCVYFTAPVKLCQHNDTVRALNTGMFNPESRSILPHSAFSGYAARFKEPQVNEGFQDITTIPFQFHGDDAQRKIWAMYWI